MKRIEQLWECPECGADWYAGDIPAEYKLVGYYDNAASFYSRLIGIYDRDKDCTTHWECPDCRHRWERDFGE